MSNPHPGALAPIDPLYKKIMWRLLPFLCLCYIVSLIERSNIGVAKLQFSEQLGFTNAIYGFGVGIFYISFILMEIPSNLYMARIGARKTLFRIMLLWGPACAGFAFMTQPYHFYILRILLGAAEAGLFPGILLYMTYWIPTHLRARFIALLMSGIPISGFIGGPLGGWIMNHFNGVAGFQGWQWLFLIEAIPPFLLAITALLYLDDKPEHAKWLTDEEKARLARELGAEESAKKGHTHGSFGAALRDPRLYAVGALGLGIQGGYGGIVFWLPTIIRDSGVRDVFHVGLLSAIPFLLAIAVQFLVARHSDRSGERRWHAATLVLVGALGWLLLPLFGQHPMLTIVCLILVVCGTFGAMGPFWSLPSSMLTGSAMAGGIALVATIGVFGSFVSPIIVGYLFDWTGSLVAGQFYYAALLIFGAIMIVSVRPKAPAAPGEVPSDGAGIEDAAFTPGEPRR